jgi:hypothetical protein
MLLHTVVFWDVTPQVLFADRSVVEERAKSKGKPKCTSDMFTLYRQDPPPQPWTLSPMERQEIHPDPNQRLNMNIHCCEHLKKNYIYIYNLGSFMTVACA